MSFSFATCERHRALDFLRKLYPCSPLTDEGPVKALLDRVEADVVRVQDPMMHKPAQLIAGTHWSEDVREAAMAEARAFHEYAVSVAVSP